MFTEPKIAPSILSADFMNMARDVAEIEEGGAAFVHVDVMDGHFVPNLTLGVPFVAGLKKITKLPLDVHLMISNPLEQLPWYLEHTPDIVTVHAEALNADAGQFDLAIDMIHDAGCKAAIAMKPDYDVELIKPYIAKLDMVLPMSVFPGFSGQSYIQGTEAKVARIVEMAREAGVSPLIEVDGGLKANDPTRAVCAAGCDVLVAGSGVFGASDRAAAIAEMKAVAAEVAGRGGFPRNISISASKIIAGDGGGIAEESLVFDDGPQKGWPGRGKTQGSTFPNFYADRENTRLKPRHSTKSYPRLFL